MSIGVSVAICEGLRYIVPNLQEAKPTAILTVPLLVESLYKKINEKIVQSKKDKIVNTMISITNTLKNFSGIDIKRKVFKDIHENLGGNLRILVSAAAPIDRKVGEWLENIGITFLQGYGLTETAPIAALTPDYKTKVGSAGKPIIQADFKIENPNENGEGEILIKSPTLMLGYYENEEETKKVIDEDGYFHSGDIGYIDEEGYLFITGRSKNVIVTQNGKNIYPEEIEMLIEKIDEVKEVMVYGKKPEEGSNKEEKELIITALVLPNYDKIKTIHGDISEKEIYDIIWKKIKEANKKLTSYKAVKSLEIKEGEFEKTSTMKIKRYKEINK
jgi:long-chain acyl-CoA synthetase